MTQPKHTPGPWLILDDFVYEENGGAVAHVTFKPNAHLIATAPEMFKAIEHALEAVKKYPDHPMTASEVLFRQVIKKAKGEA